MTRLIIWRHGQTIWNRQNRIQGQTDVPLDETGQQQASAAAELLATEAVDLLVSSDLGRARETAHALSALNGLPVEIDNRLRERQYGEWEGLTHEEISARWPTEFARWKTGQPIPECGLEDPDDVAKRVGDALLDLVEQAGDGTLVVVSHGGSARQGMGAVLGWPYHVVRAIGPLANCHWTELRGATPYWRLHAHNVGPRPVAHLPGARRQSTAGTSEPAPAGAMVGTGERSTASEKS
ncbi:MAG: histidine phosphatase family protein [Micromonosporaceae bacterium]